jgi:AcrR family transcriptional regulator
VDADPSGPFDGASRAPARRTGGATARTAGHHGVRRSPRRQQILDTAAALFAERGFHGVSVDDLGAATGVSGPALYRHFRAKEDVLVELLLGVSDALLEGGRRRRAAAPDPAAALGALVRFHVDFALDDPDVITVQARELANLSPDASRAVRSLQHRYVRLWVEVVDACYGFGTDTAAAAAHAAFGLMNSTPHSARLPRGEMAELLRAMATGAIAAVAELTRPPPS